MGAGVRWGVSRVVYIYGKECTGRGRDVLGLYIWVEFQI